ncbi:hypothetical protein CANARDRAFT_26016 [[Candida] arabinofermentans NRRL YB-2248]|uniref:Uncharacterized protein n=1 Tax=[Candida] arabinofermentans NRRL YB-2248 TaxID=983967 RepID=A0A1E4T7U3_9ASCO|nr:hypothetical protein CANARDRAFT_26016 [[Candida] arabinofermentans NRRL YB-2248]
MLLRPQSPKATNIASLDSSLLTLAEIESTDYAEILSDYYNEIEDEAKDITITPAFTANSTTNTLDQDENSILENSTIIEETFKQYYYSSSDYEKHVTQECASFAYLQEKNSLEAVTSQECPDISTEWKPLFLLRTLSAFYPSWVASDDPYFYLEDPFQAQMTLPAFTLYLKVWNNRAAPKANHYQSKLLPIIKDSLSNSDTVDCHTLRDFPYANLSFVLDDDEK